eukprot:scaffold16849_cov145-Skeletonema_menzelii.AAC.12
MNTTSSPSSPSFSSFTQVCPPTPRLYHQLVDIKDESVPLPSFPVLKSSGKASSAHGQVYCHMKLTTPSLVNARPQTLKIPRAINVYVKSVSTWNLGFLQKNTSDADAETRARRRNK